MMSIRMEMAVIVWVTDPGMMMIAKELDRHSGVFGEDWVAVTVSVGEF